MCAAAPKTKGYITLVVQMPGNITILKCLYTLCRIAEEIVVLKNRVFLFLEEAVKM